MGKRDTNSEERLGEPIIRVNIFDNSGVTIASHVIGKGTSADWELLKKRFVIPKGAVRMDMRLKAGNVQAGVLQGGGWSAFFDNIGVFKCDHNLPKPE
ncbi:MAG: hypothetical protein AAGJ93_08945 [Bacteroidota bacterium]